MPVTCIEGKLLHTQKHNLTQGKQYTIHHITDDGYIRLTDFPNISLKPSRFILADPNYNPVVYKIREMSERFEKRRELSYV